MGDTRVLDALVAARVKRVTRDWAAGTSDSQGIGAAHSSGVLAAFAESLHGPRVPLSEAINSVLRGEVGAVTATSFRSQAHALASADRRRRNRRADAGRRTQELPPGPSRSVDGGDAPQSDGERPLKGVHPGVFERSYGALASTEGLQPSGAALAEARLSERAENLAASLAALTSKLEAEQTARRDAEIAAAELRAENRKLLEELQQTRQKVISTKEKCKRLAAMGPPPLHPAPTPAAIPAASSHLSYESVTSNAAPLAQLQMELQAAKAAKEVADATRSNLIAEVERLTRDHAAACAQAEVWKQQIQTLQLSLATTKASLETQLAATKEELQHARQECAQSIADKVGNHSTIAALQHQVAAAREASAAVLRGADDAQGTLDGLLTRFEMALAPTADSGSALLSPLRAPGTTSAVSFDSPGRPLRRASVALTGTPASAAIDVPLAHSASGFLPEVLMGHTTDQLCTGPADELPPALASMRSTPWLQSTTSLSTLQAKASVLLVDAPRWEAVLARARALRSKLVEQTERNAVLIQQRDRAVDAKQQALAEIAAMREELASSQAERDAAADGRASALTQVATVTARCEQLMADLHRAQSEIASCRRALDDAAANRKRAESEATSALAEMRAKLLASESGVQSLQEQITEGSLARARAERLEADLLSTRAQSVRMRDEIVHLQADTDALSTRLAHAADDAHGAARREADLTAALDASARKLASVQGEIDRLHYSIDDLKRQLAAAKDENRHLRELAARLPVLEAEVARNKSMLASQERFRRTASQGDLVHLNDEQRAASASASVRARPLSRGARRDTHVDASLIQRASDAPLRSVSHEQQVAPERRTASEAGRHSLPQAPQTSAEHQQPAAELVLSPSGTESVATPLRQNSTTIVGSESHITDARQQPTQLLHPRATTAQNEAQNRIAAQQHLHTAQAKTDGDSVSKSDGVPKPEVVTRDFSALAAPSSTPPAHTPSLSTPSIVFRPGSTRGMLFTSAFADAFPVQRSAVAIQKPGDATTPSAPPSLLSPSLLSPPKHSWDEWDVDEVHDQPLAQSTRGSSAQVPSDSLAAVSSPAASANLPPSRRTASGSPTTTSSGILEASEPRSPPDSGAAVTLNDAPATDGEAAARTVKIFSLTADKPRPASPLPRSSSQHAVAPTINVSDAVALRQAARDSGEPQLVQVGSAATQHRALPTSQLPQSSEAIVPAPLPIAAAVAKDNNVAAANPVDESPISGAAPATAHDGSEQEGNDEHATERTTYVPSAVEQSRQPRPGARSPSVLGLPSAVEQVRQPRRGARSPSVLGLSAPSVRELSEARQPFESQHSDRSARSEEVEAAWDRLSAARQVQQGAEAAPVPVTSSSTPDGANKAGQPRESDGAVLAPRPGAEVRYPAMVAIAPSLPEVASEPGRGNRSSGETPSGQSSRLSPLPGPGINERVAAAVVPARSPTTVSPLPTAPITGPTPARIVHPLLMDTPPSPAMGALRALQTGVPEAGPPTRAAFTPAGPGPTGLFAPLQARSEHSNTGGSMSGLQRPTEGVLTPARTWQHTPEFKDDSAGSRGVHRPSKSIPDSAPPRTWQHTPELKDDSTSKLDFEHPASGVIHIVDAEAQIEDAPPPTETRTSVEQAHAFARTPMRPTPNEAAIPPPTIASPAPQRDAPGVQTGAFTADPHSATLSRTPTAWHRTSAAHMLASSSEEETAPIVSERRSPAFVPPGMAPPRSPRLEETKNLEHSRILAPSPAAMATERHHGRKAGARSADDELAGSQRRMSGPRSVEDHSNPGQPLAAIGGVVAALPAASSAEFAASTTANQAAAGDVSSTRATSTHSSPAPRRSNPSFHSVAAAYIRDAEEADPPTSAVVPTRVAARRVSTGRETDESVTVQQSSPPSRGGRHLDATSPQATAHSDTRVARGASPATRAMAWSDDPQTPLATSAMRAHGIPSATPGSRRLERARTPDDADDGASTRSGTSSAAGAAADSTGTPAALLVPAAGASKGATETHPSSLDALPSDLRAPLEAATAAVLRLSDADLNTLRGATQISDVVAVLAGALCMVCGHKPSWREAVAIMASHDFREKVRAVDPAKIQLRSVQIMQSLINTKGLRDHISGEHARVSPATAPAEYHLVDWVLRVVDASLHLHNAGMATAATPAAGMGSPPSATARGSGAGAGGMTRAASAGKMAASTPSTLITSSPFSDRALSVPKRTTAAAAAEFGPATVSAGSGHASPSPSQPAVLRLIRDGPLRTFVNRLLVGVPISKFPATSAFAGFGKGTQPRILTLERRGDEDVLVWSKPSAAAGAASHAGEDDAASRLPLVELVDVVAGMATPTLHRRGRKDRCFDVQIGRSRTLDFECTTPSERDEMLDGFKKLITISHQRHA